MSSEIKHPDYKLYNKLCKEHRQKKNNHIDEIIDASVTSMLFNINDARSVIGQAEQYIIIIYELLHASLNQITSIASHTIPKAAFESASIKIKEYINEIYSIVGGAQYNGKHILQDATTAIRGTHHLKFKAGETAYNNKFPQEDLHINATVNGDVNTNLIVKLDDITGIDINNIVTSQTITGTVTVTGINEDNSNNTNITLSSPQILNLGDLLSFSIHQPITAITQKQIITVAALTGISVGDIITGSGITNPITVVHIIGSDIILSDVEHGLNILDKSFATVDGEIDNSTALVVDDTTGINVDDVVTGYGITEVGVTVLNINGLTITLSSLQSILNCVELTFSRKTQLSFSVQAEVVGDVNNSPDIVLDNVTGIMVRDIVTGPNISSGVTVVAIDNVNNEITLSQAQTLLNCNILSFSVNTNIETLSVNDSVTISDIAGIDIDNIVTALCLSGVTSVSHIINSDIVLTNSSITNTNPIRNLVIGTNLIFSVRKHVDLNVNTSLDVVLDDVTSISVDDVVTGTSISDIVTVSGINNNTVTISTPQIIEDGVILTFFGGSTQVDETDCVTIVPNDLIINNKRVYKDVYERESIHYKFCGPMSSDRNEGKLFNDFNYVLPAVGVHSLGLTSFTSTGGQDYYINSINGWSENGDINLNSSENDVLDETISDFNCAVKVISVELDKLKGYKHILCLLEKQVKIYKSGQTKYVENKSKV